MTDLTARLSGRCAVITGGASGIGLATARRFAQEGANVVIGDIDPVTGEKAAAEVGGLFVQVDVTDEAAVNALFAAAKVSVPGAMIGATVAEWLGTNKGLGATLQQALPAAAYNELWASVLVITVASIVLYAFVGVAEKLVLAQMGTTPT